MQDYGRIKAFAFDVDGVFTDGGIFCDLDGELFRTFNAKDGFAVRMATMRGYPVGIITGGKSRSISARFTTCGVDKSDIYLWSRIKTDDILDFCSRHGISPGEVLYIGDDIPDIEALKLCGIAVCPSDAAEEVKAVCDIVSEFPGGKGCVRSMIRDVMIAQGTWTFDSSLYKKLY